MFVLVSVIAVTLKLLFFLAIAFYFGYALVKVSEENTNHTFPSAKEKE